jgi:hypothetical protein
MLKAANGRRSLCRSTEPLKIISLFEVRYSAPSLAAEGCLLSTLDVVFCSSYLRKCKSKTAHSFPQFLHPIMRVGARCPGFHPEAEVTSRWTNVGQVRTHKAASKFLTWSIPSAARLCGAEIQDGRSHVNHSFYQRSASPPKFIMTCDAVILLQPQVRVSSRPEPQLWTRLHQPRQNPLRMPHRRPAGGRR